MNAGQLTVRTGFSFDEGLISEGNVVFCVYFIAPHLSPKLFYFYGWKSETPKCVVFNVLIKKKILCISTVIAISLSFDHCVLHIFDLTV